MSAHEPGGTSAPPRRQEPPTGVVTLVFTDVQGSTALWEHHPAAMRVALALHDETLHQLVLDCAGYEVKTEGDSFMVAFAAPAAAVAWCLRAQQALLDLAWPEELLASDEAAPQPGPDGRMLWRGLRVRMGVHAGTVDGRVNATTGRLDYFGSTVNRAARVAHAAHGGQIIVSSAVMQGLTGCLGTLGDPVVVELGEHGFRGVDAALALVQVLPRSLSARRFPPPRALNPRKTNLVPAATAFVGRTRDLAQLEELVAKGHRVITLVGPGGMGKTRFALHFAAAHVEAYSRDGGGVWFCDLTEARNIDGICRAVGQVLAVPLTAGKTIADIVSQLGHAMAGRGRLLLVLDNFEQVVGDAPATLGHWQALAPETRFLVTSREHLHLPGEVVHELGPLSVNDDTRPGGGSDAEDLFMERAGVARPGWMPAEPERALVTEVVQRLDGMPLAIELAAARMNVLGPRALLQRLPERFALLAGRGPSAQDRRGTLRGTIQWSWELLTPFEQAALAQCSVFRGGFSLEAAEHVLDLSDYSNCPWVPDIVQALREKSLLRVFEPPDLPGELRFGMYESIREFATAELVKSRRSHSTEARHAAYFLRVGAEWAERVDLHGGVGIRRRLAGEMENLTAVFERGLAGVPTAAAVTQAAQALLALDPVLATRGPFSLHQDMLDRAVRSAAAPGVDPLTLGGLLQARGIACEARGRLHDARVDLDRAVALAVRHGDRRAEARALNRLGIVLQGLGLLDEARRAYDTALAIFRELADRRFEASVTANLAKVDQETGELDTALTRLDAAREIFREIGNRRFEGLAIGDRGSVLHQQGRLDEAGSQYERAIAIFQEVEWRRYEAAFLGNLGLLRWEQGKLDEARAHYCQGIATLREVGDRRFEGVFLGSLGAIEASLGHVADADQALADAEQLLLAAGDNSSVAEVGLKRGHVDLARAREALAGGRPAEAAAWLDAARLRVAAVHAPGGADASHPEGAPAPATRSAYVRFAERLLCQALDGFALDSEADPSLSRHLFHE